MQIEKHTIFHFITLTISQFLVKIPLLNYNIYMRGSYLEYEINL